MSRRKAPSFSIIFEFLSTNTSRKIDRIIISFFLAAPRLFESEKLATKRLCSRRRSHVGILLAGLLSDSSISSQVMDVVNPLSGRVDAWHVVLRL